MRTLQVFMSIAIVIMSARADDPRLKKAGREDRNGWISVHLEGTPAEIGFQHGYLLAPEIDDVLRMYAYYINGSVKKDWSFFREAAERLFWPKLEKEYQDEILGIVEGLKARGYAYDNIDITALNGNIELVSYYLPYLANKIKAD